MDGRKPLFYFLMFTVSLVLVLAIGELLARFFVTLQRIPAPPPVSTIDPYKANPYLIPGLPYIHFHIPGSRYIQARSYYQVDYEINSMGFRGPEILPKSPDVKRLIVIGDSMVEGHGNHFTETFSYLLGENIAWEVVNMGALGASPLYYATNLKRYLSVSPDAVLIVIFENDLRDDRVLEPLYLSYPFIDDEETLLMGSTGDSFLSNLRLYTLLRRGWWYLVQSPLDEMVEQNSEVTYTKDEQEAIEAFEKLALGNTHLVAPAVFDKQWDMTQPYLDYVVSSFRRRGIQVMIANMALVGPNFNKVHRQHTSSLDDKVSRWANAENLPFLSLLPMISDAIKEHSHSKIMIHDDGHPTAMTHRLIEGALQPWVVKNLNRTAN